MFSLLGLVFINVSQQNKMKNSSCLLDYNVYAFV
jgi:hypothetical protein